MSYLVLARKYRPQRFEDLVGQGSVSQTLQNALTSNRMAHAYVFSGPRGIGKTTVARLLAKCLNCQTGVTITPCKKCPSCVAIAEGTSMQDVLEIDGASNRGIEQIRELRENAKYAPTSSRYRIFIIDEAHQITKDAFGALLKTLEEPPPHVIFMMATTEVQKIPAPILSRCQRFSLRPISPNLIFNHLKSICEKEKVKVNDEALKDIVRFVEGSLRDALSILDQAVVFSPQGVTAETLRDLLGVLPADMVARFAAVIEKGDAQEVIQHIASLLKDGMDFTELAKNLQDHYHQLLLAKAGVQDALSEASAELKAAAAQIPFGHLERNIRLLQKTLDDMRFSSNPRAVFEVTCLQMSRSPLDPSIFIERLEKLEGKLNDRTPGSPTSPSALEKTAGVPAYQPPSPAKTISASFSSAPPPSSVRPQPSAAAAPAGSFKPVPAASSATSTLIQESEIKSQWMGFTAQVAEQRQSLGTALEEAGVSAAGNRIKLTVLKPFNQSMIEKSKPLIETMLAKFFNAPLTLETALASPAAPLSSPSSLPHTAPGSGHVNIVHAPEPIDNEPDIEVVTPDQAGAEAQQALKHFPGTLKKVKKKP